MRICPRVYSLLSLLTTMFPLIVSLHTLLFYFLLYSFLPKLYSTLSLQVFNSYLIRRDMDKERKMRGNQIPGFENWDDENELPITQSFECARQAGLSRYTSSGQSKKPHTALPCKQGKAREKRSGSTQTQAREGNRKQAGKVFDMTATELPHAHHLPAVNSTNKKQQQFEYEAGLCKASKAVDEDLYKISPHLLHRKRRAGFFSRCLMSPCGV